MMGIVHSFRILEDQFAQGDKRLINNKKYYFVAIAYGYNEYEKYNKTLKLKSLECKSFKGQQQTVSSKSEKTLKL
jgi:hypothetical protein